MRWVAAPLAAVLATLAIAGCGQDGAEPGAPEGATLVLDFQPNAVHAALYAAKARGYVADGGVELEIREPSSTTDSAKLLEAGRADLAILDINDFGIARERGLEIVALAAIVQRPLASVIARNEIRTPADLAGGTVGVTGVPSDDAVLDTVLASAGLPPDSVERVTIGFTAVPALAAGRIDAATAFWNAEGIELRRQGIPIREFRVDQLGAPRYPELILAARGNRAPESPELSCPVLRALGRAYGDLELDPNGVLEAMLSEVEGLDPESQRAQFAELVANGAFSPGMADLPDPALTAAAGSEWESWARSTGILGDARPGEIAGAFLPDEVRRCATATAG